MDHFLTGSLHIGIMNDNLSEQVRDNKGHRKWNCGHGSHRNRSHAGYRGKGDGSWLGAESRGPCHQTCAHPMSLALPAEPTELLLLCLKTNHFHCQPLGIPFPVSLPGESTFFKLILPGTAWIQTTSKCDWVQSPPGTHLSPCSIRTPTSTAYDPSSEVRHVTQSHSLQMAYTDFDSLLPSPALTPPRRFILVLLGDTQCNIWRSGVIEEDYSRAYNDG